MSVKSTEGKLAIAERYYDDYGARARELRKQGHQFIGYLCAYVPVEIISAAGFIPFRIKGNVDEPITMADTQMETIVCPLVRNCFDLSLRRKYDFLDGLVIPHACDSICRTYDVWKYSLGLSYNHLINIPHETSDSSLRFFINILKTFRQSLGGFAGKEISDQNLIRAIELYNQVRSKVRALYELRKTDPPQISGSEVIKVLVAGAGIPVEEFGDLLTGVIEEAKERSETGTEKLPRVMVVGAQLDNANFFDLVEDSGAAVVVDDLCPGTREYFPQVSPTDDPIPALAERYLIKINCARTYRRKTGTYEEYLEERFGHIGKFVKEFNVDGVILYFYKYCDPFGFEVPQMKSYIEGMGTPVLYLEDEYSMSTIGRLRTRIQAFLELIT